MQFATRVPMDPATDSPRLQAIKTSLNGYFAAVSLQGVDRATKLQAIADCFCDDAELITPTGVVLRGREQVVGFYASPQSPVMKDPFFCPQVNVTTLAVSANENTVAVEIALTETMTVGDWFTFDTDADTPKICRLRIYDS
eukprot:scaffold43688_cov367-Amphora_coffeaeformis.AAC.1